MLSDIKLHFFGGAQEVTGVNYLLEAGDEKILVDCGLFQGARTCEEKNDLPFSFKPSEISALITTHAHLDHIGRVPKLAAGGFNGRIISTPPTKDFSELMLIDSLGILTKEAEREHKKCPYSEADVKKAISLWETVEYGNEFSVGNLKFILREAGHILGSSMLECTSDGRKIVFSGDLGNPPTPLLNEPYKPKDINYLIIESTYGNREHEGRDERKLKLERIIEDVVMNKGVLMIPAFSIERTQELLFEINDLVENGRIPQIPVFLDSPLAIKVTAIYRKYESYYNKEAKYIIKSGDDVFRFPGLKMTLTRDESISINDIPPPKIIIAGSGMSTGGRIVHHEKRYLSNPKNILLMINYQGAGSLGRVIEDGARWVDILGEKIPVNAKIETIKGYSSHPDTNALFDFVENSVDSIKKVFVTQGEARAALFFVQRLRDYLGLDAVAPKEGDSFLLE